MGRALRTKITRGIFFVSTMLMLANCTGKNNLDQWDDAKIDPGISKDIIYKQLDKQKEIFSMWEKQDSLAKRTSDVSYIRSRENYPRDTLYAKFNNSRAYFFNPDTLSINIGFGTGYGGRGFIINCRDKKFYTQAYLSTDVITVGEVEPIHKIISQKLTLDKANYAVGDSLFGKIEFKSVETTQKGDRTEHFGKGNFRTKVSKF